LVEQSLLGELYTPTGLRSTILFPGTNGGANWGGASYDPESHTLYVNSMDVGTIRKMIPLGEGALIPYRSQGMGTPSSRFWIWIGIPVKNRRGDILRPSIWIAAHSVGDLSWGLWMP
jgi:hypothetical protein